LVLSLLTNPFLLIVDIERHNGPGREWCLHSLLVCQSRIQARIMGCKIAFG
jgi:hypothetical protein